MPEGSRSAPEGGALPTDAPQPLFEAGSGAESIPASVREDELPPGDKAASDAGGGGTGVSPTNVESPATKRAREEDRRACNAARKDEQARTAFAKHSVWISGAIFVLAVVVETYTPVEGDLAQVADTSKFVLSTGPGYVLGRGAIGK